MLKLGQYATFLYALFDAITSPDGSLKEIDTEDGSSYRLSSIDDVDSIAREDGTVVIEGVRTLNPFAADEHMMRDLCWRFRA